MNQDKTIYHKTFFKICFASFCLFLSFNLILSELPRYLKSLGGEEYIGLIIGFFTLSAGLSRPFSGRLTDTWGRRPVFIVGVLATFFAGWLYPFTISVAMFFFIRFLHGISAGFSPTGTSTMIADLAPVNKRGEALGVLGFFTAAGLALGPTLGTWLATKIGLDNVFYCSSIIGLIGLVVMLTVEETKPLGDEVPESKLSFDDVIDRRVLLPGLNTLFVLFSFGTVLTVMPDYCDLLGVSNRGLFFTVYVCTSMVLRYFMGRLSDRFGRKKLLLMSNVVFSLSMFAMIYIDNVTHLVLLGVLYGIAVGINSPTTFAWVIDLSKGKQTGRALSTTYLFLEAGIGMGAVGAGAFYKGDVMRLPFCFMVAGSVAFVAVVLMAVNIYKAKHLD